ncbi:Serine/threonine-protein kinase Nek4 [Rhizophlyctis rosea]|nr:Serine/threonine-protein kinase Nek4 [Rhizophlyctis rosea]
MPAPTTGWKTPLMKYENVGLIGKSNNHVLLVREKRTWNGKFQGQKKVAAKYLSNSGEPKLQQAHHNEFILGERSAAASGFVCQYLEFWPGHSHDMIVMEYLERGDLHLKKKELAHDHRRPEEWLMWVLAHALATAIADLHRVGVVHGDLKHANVLLTKTAIKLVDFGTATSLKDVYGDYNRNRSGTRGFQSPERLECLPWNGAADIWGLGVLLFEFALPGTRFVRDEDWEIFHEIDIEGWVTTQLSVMRQFFSEDLVEFLRGCLAQYPRDRPTAACLSTTAAQHLHQAYRDPTVPH